MKIYKIGSAARLFTKRGIMTKLRTLRLDQVSRIREYDCTEVTLDEFDPDVTSKIKEKLLKSVK